MAASARQPDNRRVHAGSPWREPVAVAAIAAVPTLLLLLLIGMLVSVTGGRTAPPTAARQDSSTTRFGAATAAPAPALHLVAAQPTLTLAAAPTADAPPAVVAPWQLRVEITEGALADPTTWGYTPRQVTVQVGETVTWTNAGMMPHTITAEGGSFDSGILDAGARWSYTASRPGTYPYLCELHPEMRGVLVVEGDAATEAPGAAEVAVQPPAPPVASPAPLAAAAPPPPAGGAQQAARIVKDGYLPATIRARVGETITWTNTDDKRHTVTATGGQFDSGALAAGGRWSFTPTTPGTFAYVCEFHPDMRGSLIVVAADGGATLAQPGPGGPAAPAAASEPPPQPARVGRSEATLAGSGAFASVSGRVRFEDDRFRAELRGAEALTGTKLDVYVDGRIVGSMPVERNGDARLELRNGHTAAPVEIKTPSGTLVASG